LSQRSTVYFHKLYIFVCDVVMDGFAVRQRAFGARLDAAVKALPRRPRSADKSSTAGCKTPAIRGCGTTGQRSGHPFKKTVVRTPGPSCTVMAWMSNYFPRRFFHFPIYPL
jgi:hypothetical protein